MVTHQGGWKHHVFLCDTSCIHSKYGKLSSGFWFITRTYSTYSSWILGNLILIPTSRHCQNFVAFPPEVIPTSPQKHFWISCLLMRRNNVGRAENSPKSHEDKVCCKHTESVEDVLHHGDIQKGIFCAHLPLCKQTGPSLQWTRGWGMVEDSSLVPYLGTRSDRYSPFWSRSYGRD